MWRWWAAWGRLELGGLCRVPPESAGITCTWGTSWEKNDTCPVAYIRIVNPTRKCTYQGFLKLICIFFLSWQILSNFIVEEEGHFFGLRNFRKFVSNCNFNKWLFYNIPISPYLPTLSLSKLKRGDWLAFTKFYCVTYCVRITRAHFSL